MSGPDQGLAHREVSGPDQGLAHREVSGPDQGYDALLFPSAELQAAFEEKEEAVDELTALKMSIESDLLNTSELTPSSLKHMLPDLEEWVKL